MTRDSSREVAAAETQNLAHLLAIDFAKLAAREVPALPVEAVAELEAARDLGITARMDRAGGLLRQHLNEASLDVLAGHPADTVRGWVCYAWGRDPRLTLAEKLRRLRKLADDAHFGVREWAWLAARPSIAAELEAALELLIPWSGEASANLRRYATEATRPRGVWCAHLTMLREAPWKGLPLLQPLRADASKYVQDSVSNWLNDASKDHPVWVQELCALWCAEMPRSVATDRICRRALRTIAKH